MHLCLSLLDELVLLGMVLLTAACVSEEDVYKEVGWQFDDLLVLTHTCTPVPAPASMLRVLVLT